MIQRGVFEDPDEIKSIHMGESIRSWSLGRGEREEQGSVHRKDESLYPSMLRLRPLIRTSSSLLSVEIAPR
jgi:hypothetical protein